MGSSKPCAKLEHVALIWVVKFQHDFQDCPAANPKVDCLFGLTISHGSSRLKQPPVEELHNAVCNCCGCDPAADMSTARVAMVLCPRCGLGPAAVLERLRVAMQTMPRTGADVNAMLNS